MATGVAQGVRLAELVASLSLAVDLGLGQPEEHVLRQTVIATRLATAADLHEDLRAAAFYVSLLAGWDASRIRTSSRGGLATTPRSALPCTKPTGPGCR